MASNQAFMGNPFDPDGIVTIIGFAGGRSVNLDGPLKKIGPCLWEGDGLMFNARGVQVLEGGELVRPPAAMAVNRG